VIFKHFQHIFNKLSVAEGAPTIQKMWRRQQTFDGSEAHSSNKTITSLALF